MHCDSMYTTIRQVRASDKPRSGASPQWLRVDHVQLAMPVGGEADARRFYTDVLGLAEVPKPAALAARGGCWFESGEVRVHLGVEDDFHPARKAHPALVVRDLPRGTRPRSRHRVVARHSRRRAWVRARSLRQPHRADLPVGRCAVRSIRYQEIAGSIRERVEAAAPGALLPSESELSSEFGVSRVTVRRALELLRDEGSIAARQGFGWFVVTEPVQQRLDELGTIEAQLEHSGRRADRRCWSSPSSRHRRGLPRCSASTRCCACGG
ncbi:MAG: GntR family transcriptional regulator [Ilumatobacteraceae bacterium]